MPNWCQNEVSIHGKEEELTEFKEFVKSTEGHHGKCAEKYRSVKDENDKWDRIEKEHCGGGEFEEDCIRIVEDFSFNSILPMPILLEGLSAPPNVLETQEEVDKFNEERNPYMGKAITQEQLDEIVKTTGHADWYNWCVEKWGTKWNVSDVDFEDEGDLLKYYFDTAWCAPYGIYDALVEKFPNISISWFYREEGQQFAGYLPE